MKYLKLYDAFDASVLNSLNSFLKSKVSKDSMNKFTKDLEKLGIFADFKISELGKDDIDYLKYEEALKIKGDTPNLYCVKYWFSADKGYIGYTGTSNKVLEIDRSGYGNRPTFIPDDYLKRLSRDYSIKGKVVECKPVDFKTGDDIVMCCDGYDMSYSDLIIGKMYVREDGYLFAIQNRKAGGTPGGEGWKQYGQYSWSMGRLPDLNYSDQSCLRKIIIDDSIDGLIWVNETPKEIDGIVDPFLYNLELTSSFTQVPWVEYYEDEDGEGYYDEDDNWVSTADKETLKYKIKNNANYAIVIYLDRLTNKGKVSSLISDRASNKKDAIALLSNDEFKKANIDRYVTKLFDIFNIKPDDNSNMTNLNKFIITILCGEYFMVNFLLQGNTSISYLSNCINYLFEINNSNNSDRGLTYYTALKNLYIDRRKYYSNNKNLIDVSRCDDVVKEVFKIYMEIGKMVLESIKKKNISNVYEFKGLYYKLNTIISLSNDGYLFDQNIARYFRSNEFRNGQPYNGDFSKWIEKSENMKKAISAIL